MYVCVDRKTQTTKGLWAFLFHFEHEPSFSSFFFFLLCRTTLIFSIICVGLIIYPLLFVFYLKRGSNLDIRDYKYLAVPTELAPLDLFYLFVNSIRHVLILQL